MPEGESDSTSRRQLLRAASPAVGAALVGCSFVKNGSPTATEPPSPTESPAATEQTTADKAGGIPSALEANPRFDTVVNVVDDGADPEAGTSIVPYLEEHVGDSTALYFPPGRYLMDDLLAFPEFSHFALVGNRATIVPPAGYDRYLFAIGSERHSSRDLLLDGLRFDFRRAGTPRPIQAIVDDQLFVRDFEVVGTTGTVRFDVMNPDGTGQIERLRLPDGGDSVGCFAGPITRGKLRFVDCEIAGFPGNGLYASSPKGPVDVIGGSYRNNGIASIRVSGASVVRQAHVRCDRVPEKFENMRGIRFRHGRDGLIEDCIVEMLRTTYSDGGIVLEPFMESATIRNTRVRISTDRVPALKAKSPEGTPHSGRLRCENLRITGSGAGYSTVLIVDRDDTLLDGLSISQTGTERNGIHLIRANDTVISDTEIDVTGEPILSEECEPRLENVTLSSEGEQADWISHPGGSEPEEPISGDGTSTSAETESERK